MKKALKRFKRRYEHSCMKYYFYDLDWTYLLSFISLIFINIFRSYFSILIYFLALAGILAYFRYLHLDKRCFFCHKKIRWSANYIKEVSKKSFRFYFRIFHPECFIKQYLNDEKMKDERFSSNGIWL